MEMLFMKRLICFYETYKLVLQLVMMTWGSVNRVLEVLKVKLIKSKSELNFESFLPENEAIALFSIQNPFKFLSASGLI